MARHQLDFTRTTQPTDQAAQTMVMDLSPQVKLTGGAILDRPPGGVIQAIGEDLAREAAIQHGKTGH
jgi:hypothetical protein